MLNHLSRASLSSLHSGFLNRFILDPFYSKTLITYSFKYNQQDSTLYNILYYCQLRDCGCFSAHDQELKSWFQLNHASGSSKQAWHIQDAVCTVLELLMMGVETARNMYSIDNNKEYCITLHPVGCT